MANAAIGSFQFIGDNTPRVSSPNMKLEPMEREGIDGYEMCEIGARCGPVIWETFADSNDAAGLIEDYNDISGTLVTVTNIDGSTVDTVAVELLAANAKRIAKAVGGLTAGAWAVTAQWKLQATV